MPTLEAKRQEYAKLLQTLKGFIATSEELIQKLEAENADLRSQIKPSKKTKGEN